jgi:predicted NAD/FAD-dependent oxidoreductase
MSPKLLYAVVQDQPRKVIHVVRVMAQPLEPEEIHELAERMRQRALSRYGDQAADVVVVQGNTKETLRLSGDAHCVRRVRTAMFNAELRWAPIELD